MISDLLAADADLLVTCDQVIDFLDQLSVEVLHGFQDFGEGLLERADVVSLVESVNDTLWADWRTAAVEAKV